MRAFRTIFRIREGEAPAEPMALRVRLGGSLALLGLFALLLACGGCWEEIHYVPKPAGVQPAEQPTAETPPEAVPEFTVAEPNSTEEPAIAPPADADPLMLEAEAPPSPGADDLFSPEGPAEVAVEAPAGSDDVPAEATPIDGSILPTPEGLAADFEQEGATEAESAGGGHAASSAEPTPRPATTAEERRLVWEAASKWSLAAAIYAKGLEAGRYQSILDESIAAAAKLNVELPPLPSATGADELEATVIESLRGESAVALANAFAQRFDAAEAATADLAIRSHLLLLTYSPRSGDAVLQAEALRRAGEASGLPTGAWTPLVTLLDERAPFVDVRQAVFEQSRRIEKHLGAASGGTP